MKTKLLFLMIALLMVFPVSTFASGSYVAGDLTATALSDSLDQGNQIHFHATLEGISADQEDTDQMKAFNEFLSFINIDATVYQKDGRYTERLCVKAKDVQLMEILAFQMPDGTIRAKTSLTGDTLFDVPIDLNADGFSPLALLTYDSDIQSTDEAFNDLPAMERLRITTSETVLLVTQAVLGWVSGSQIESDGEMYVFDFTYIEPTDTRSGVAQRMIGNVGAAQFCSLLWSVASIVDWQAGNFQQAVADVLAECGVTRLQVRAVVDAMFPDIMIDPAEDYVEPTHTIPDDGALCQYSDVSYFFKKFTRFSDKIWEESLEEDLKLTVSYDDYGELVGLDAYLPKFTESLPYEGTFTASSLTDDDWQVLTTAHGELQVDENSRVIGNYRHLNGEDIDGHNGNTFDADLMLVDQTDKSEYGFSITGEWTYDTQTEDNGIYEEKTAGNGGLSFRLGTDDLSVFSAQLEGVMQTTGTDFSYHTDMDFALLDQMKLRVSMDANQEAVEEIPVPEGEIIDVTKMSAETRESLIAKIQAEGMRMLIRVMTNKELSENLKIMLGE